MTFIPNLGPKAVAGMSTDLGIIKIVLDQGGAIVDLPLLVIESGASIVDNGDSTITITLV